MKRPKLISVLAFFCFLSGLLSISLLLSNNDFVQEIFFLDISTIYFSVLLLGIIYLGSGIGMWLGKRWGWYLGAICYCYAIIRNSFALVQLSQILRVFNDLQQEAGLGYFKFFARIIGNGLILSYFFKSNVINYFQVNNRSNWKKAGLVLGVTLIIFLGVFGSAFLHENNNQLTAITLLYNTGELEPALSKVNKYLETNLEDNEAWELKGDILCDIGKLAEAKTSYLRAVSLKPDSYQVLTALGLIYRKETDYDKSMEYYQKAVEFKPDYAVVYTNMAVVELKRNNDKKALEYAQKAYDLDNHQPVFVANLAICHYYLGNEEVDKYITILEGMDYANIEIIKQICRGELTVKDN